VSAAGRDLVLGNAEVGARAVDVVVRGGLVWSVEAAGTVHVPPTSQRIDCGGGAVLPGLSDHHLHLLALAAGLGSADCGPRAAPDRSALARVLRAAPVGADGWVRGVGHSDRTQGPLDRDVIDALLGDRAGVPVRVQDRSGAFWTLGSAAVEAVGLAAADHPGIERDRARRPTGRLWRADGWLRQRLPPTPPPDLAPVGRLLAAHGVTAVTDATAELGADGVRVLAAAAANGALPQRLQVLGVDRAPAAIGLGPRKIVLSDHELPTLDDLTCAVAAAHAAGSAVALHCVTGAALLLALAALADAGRVEGDRIEHAAVVPAGVAPLLRGLRVVTQPAFLADRGDDFLDAVEPDDATCLYPYASLLAAGVRVAASSDAPHGPFDPWQILRSARDRLTASGRVVVPTERVSVATALDGLLSRLDDPGGTPRRVAPGEPADLVLLRTPLAEALHNPDAGLVAMTLIGGRVVHGGAP